MQTAQRKTHNKEEPILPTTTTATNTDYGVATHADMAGVAGYATTATTAWRRPAERLDWGNTATAIDGWEDYRIHPVHTKGTAEIISELIKEQMERAMEDYFGRFVDVTQFHRGDRVAWNTDEQATETLDKLIHQCKRFYATPNPNGKVKIVFKNGKELKAVSCDLYLVDQDSDISDEEFFSILQLEEVPAT